MCCVACSAFPTLYGPIKFNRNKSRELLYALSHGKAHSKTV